MELHYKAYQKIKIYLDKIRCALSNLNLIVNRMVFISYRPALEKRQELLRFIQAELVAYCMALKK